MAEVDPASNAIFVSLAPKSATVPPEPPASGHLVIDPSDAGRAFAEAIASLPDNGGTLYVVPGTEPYRFQDSVVVDKPNVTIQLVRGTVLRFAPLSTPNQTTTALFEVLEPGFHAHGLHIVLSNETFNRTDLLACVLLWTDDARFDDCTFDVEEAL